MAFQIQFQLEELEHPGVNGTTITASITNESVDELKLKEGTTAYAIIKSSDVMAGVEH